MWSWSARLSFRNKICEHLSDYRLNSLGVQEDGKFFYRGEFHDKKHILDLQKSNLNLIENYRAQFLLTDKNQPIKRHRYFHHLNSSQALCLNLFFPLIAEKQLPTFIDYLGIDNKDELIPTFEKESDIEVATRKTSFDFYVKTRSNFELFVEVKYTEEGFGKAKRDPEHEEKFNKTYSSLLKRLTYLNPICSEMDFFLNHYQVLRNLVHISGDSNVIFLFPRDNLKVSKEAEFARDFCLNDAGRKRFKIVYLEDLVTFFEKKFHGDNLGHYYQSFRKKYLPSFNPQV